MRAKEENRRIVAIGTTVVRSLEWWYLQGCPQDGISGWCDLFLKPPWNSQIVEALLTNFHLPKSSLMALVAAFLGKNGEQNIGSLYEQAIEKSYKFYSYGDCMLIL